MRTCIDICLHCGKEYYWQASGSWALDTPEKYNSDKYCPSCKKALDDALNAIPIEFKNKGIKIDKLYDFDPRLKEVTPEYIFKLIEEKEEALRKESEENGLPICRRVYANLWSEERREHSQSGEISDKFTQNYRETTRRFFYFYWPSKPEEMEITVKMRVDSKTDKIVDYARYNWQSQRNL